MNILHTADWHLGQYFYGHERNREQQVFLDWLVETLKSERIDLLLISGDVFDVANPSAQSQRQLYRFLTQAHQACPQLQTIITAGNHDSATRLEAPGSLLENFNVRIVGTIQRKEDRSIDYERLLLPAPHGGSPQAWVLAIPFPRPGDLPSSGKYSEGIAQLYQEAYQFAREKVGGKAPIIAMGHLHAMDADTSADDRSERTVIGGVESVPVTAFDEGLAYTALGHIHRPQKVGGRKDVRYSGSPLPMSFTEREYKHQVVKVVLGEEKAEAIEPIPIPIPARLRQIPAQPSPLKEVLKSLEELPDQDEGGKEGFWDYAEVQVALSEPEPSLKQQVQEVTSRKQIKLAKITPHYPNRNEESEGSMQMRTQRDLEQLNPQKLFEQIYDAAFGGKIPEEIQNRFDEVVIGER